MPQICPAMPLINYWITLTGRGSRRILPRPENATMNANARVITRYAVYISMTSRQNQHSWYVHEMAIVAL